MIDTAESIIRISVAVTMIAFGLHQITSPKSWRHYIPKWLRVLAPIPDTTMMRSHGFGNAILGILFLIGLWPLAMAWIVLIWWVSILPFAFRAQWDIGLRDLTIICALAGLLLLLHSN